MALRALLPAGLAAVIAATAAKSTAQETTGEAFVPAELAGTEWRLVELDGRAPDPALPPVTLSFKRRAEGSGGCNWYTGWLEPVADRGFVVSHLAITGRDCAHPRIMEVEARYLAALEEVSAYRVMDGELALIYPTTEGEERMVFRPD